jgi:hypothetical protein
MYWQSLSRLAASPLQAAVHRGAAQIAADSTNSNLIFLLELLLSLPPLNAGRQMVRVRN